MSLSDSIEHDRVSGGIQLLKVLYDQQKELLLSSGDIQKDETPINVGVGSKKGQSASVPLAFIKDVHFDPLTGKKRTSITHTRILHLACLPASNIYHPPNLPTPGQLSQPTPRLTNSPTYQLTDSLHF
jgi:hypothetical protein